MKRLVKYVTLFLILLCLGPNNFLSAQENQKKEEKKFTSLWEGKLKISSVSLRLVLKVFNNSDGSVGALLDSPDQGANNIPVSSVNMTDDSLKFAIQTIGASYMGKIYKDSAFVKGSFKQGGMVLPLDLKKLINLLR